MHRIKVYTRFVHFSRAFARTVEEHAFARAVYDIKDGEGNWKKHLEEIASKVNANHDLAGATLIPIPRSTVAEKHWPAAEFAALLNGRRNDAIARRISIARSHSASATQRPTIAKQVDSLTCNTSEVRGRAILVDDVVTRGTQLAAATQVLRNAGFTGEIEGLAMCRTFTHDMAPNGRNMYWWLEWSDHDEYPTMRAFE